MNKYVIPLFAVITKKKKCVAKLQQMKRKSEQYKQNKSNVEALILKSH